MKTKLYFVITLLMFFTLTVLPSGFAQGPLAQPSVRLVYFLPSDRPARPDRIEALKTLILEAQEFYADEMQRHGFGRKTFRIETDRNGEPIVHRFNGRFNEHHYYQRLTDFKVWEEFYQKVNDIQHVYFIAIDLSSELLNEGESCGLGGVTFFPSGENAPGWSFGSGAVRHRDEIQSEAVLGGSAIIPVSGHCFQDNRGFLHPLRVTTHELAHAFGLDHDFSDPDSAVGGRGFRFSECDTEWLSMSRYFNSKLDVKNAQGNIQLIAPPTYSAKGITFRFEVTDADSLHQAQLLVPEDGSWGPWKLIGCQKLDGHRQTVEFVTTELVTTPVERVMLQFVDDLGTITWATILTDIASIVPPPKFVSIPDRNLAAAVREALKLDRNARITDQAMRRLRFLNLDDRRITNTAGLEYATQLETLLLGRNQIINYAPLAKLPKLKKLYLWGNGISDLNVLPPMPQLAFLDLNWNQISDLSPLAKFTSLKELWLQENELADTSTLFQLHNGTFPPDEEVKVTEERESNGRTYTLLTFQSLNLKVRIDPDVKVYWSLNAVPTANVLVEKGTYPPIYWIDTAAGTLHRLIGNEVENLAPSVQNATSLAIDMTGGKLYWAEKISNTRGKIRRANLNGTNVQLVKRLTSVPLSITLDTLNRKIYLTNAWGKVQRLSIDGSNFQPNLITGLQAPNHLALDATRGKIYWTEQTSDRTAKIRRANLDGSNVQLVKDLTSVPRGIALDTTNRKIYLTNASGKVQRMNLNGSSFKPNLITSLESPEGTAVDAVSRKLYWTEKGGIRRANLNGKNIKNIVTGLDTPA
ncbi:hypothetical protein C6496_18580, partial [Candidatus Poribacteria bacterium]